MCIDYAFNLIGRRVKHDLWLFQGGSNSHLICGALMSDIIIVNPSALDSSGRSITAVSPLERAPKQLLLNTSNGTFSFFYFYKKIKRTWLHGYQRSVGMETTEHAFAGLRGSGRMTRQRAALTNLSPRCVTTLHRDVCSGSMIIQM